MAPPSSESLARLREVARDVVRPAFRSSMTAEVESAMIKELEQWANVRHPGSRD